MIMTSAAGMTPKINAANVLIGGRGASSSSVKGGGVGEGVRVGAGVGGAGGVGISVGRGGDVACGSSSERPVKKNCSESSPSVALL